MTHKIILLPLLIIPLLVFPILEAKAYTPAPLNPTEHRLLTQVHKALKENRRAWALKTLSRHFKLTARPHDYAYELHGHLLIQDKNFKGAIGVLERGTSLYPKNPSLVQNLGVAYSRCQMPKRAGKSFMRAYELGDKKHPSLAFSGAVFLSRAGEWNQTRAILEDLIREKGERPPWILFLSQAYLKTEAGDLAVPLLKKAIDTHPGNRRLWRMLGFVHYSMERSEEAAAAFRVARDLAQDKEKNKNNLARFFIGLGAVRAGERVLEDPDPALLDHLAISYARTGDLEKALERAQKAWEKEPSPQRRFRLALVFMRMGKYHRATAHFRALANTPGPLRNKARWGEVMAAWQQRDWERVSQLLGPLASQDSPLALRALRLRKIMNKINGSPTHSTSRIGRGPRG